MPVINYTLSFYIQTKITPSYRPHRCAVEQRCINGDGLCQCRTAKFDPTEYRPLNQLIKMAQLSTSRTRPLCQISSKYVHGWLPGKCVYYLFFLLICIFNFYLSSVVSMIIADKKQIKRSNRKINKQSTAKQLMMHTGCTSTCMGRTYW